MTLKYLMNRRRRLSKSFDKSVDLGFIKDAIITQTQPLYGHEIVDLDIGDAEDGKINIRFYYQSRRQPQSAVGKESKSRTGKD